MALNGSGIYHVFLLVLQDESKKTAHDSCLTPQEIQVHGAIAQVHEAVLPGGVSSGITALQHIRRCRQLRSDVRPGSCCCSLWKVMDFYGHHKLLPDVCQGQSYPWQNVGRMGGRA